MTNSAINLALSFLHRGIAVIPVKYRDKRPLLRWQQYQSQLPTEQELRWWFAKPRNIGIITGWQGLTVLDFDDMSDYSKWLLWARSQPGPPEWVSWMAYKVVTSRGVHVYIRLPKPERTRRVGKIDIKCRGGYVIGAGSIHPSGAVYTPLTEHFNFPLVANLSDVLPAAVLADQDLPAGVVNPVVARSVDDPWLLAMLPRSAPPGTGVIDKIRASLSIESFFGNTIATGDHWLLTTCPLHDDRHPSFWIDTQRQICGCFAGCTPKPLDVINLFARLHSMSNDDAIAILREQIKC